MEYDIDVEAKKTNALANALGVGPINIDASFRLLPERSDNVSLYWTVSIPGGGGRWTRSTHQEALNAMTCHLKEMARVRMAAQRKVLSTIETAIKTLEGAS